MSIGGKAVSHLKAPTQRRHHLFWLSAGLTLASLAICAAPARSCQIEYSDWLIGVLRNQGVSLEKRVGSFGSLEECNTALRLAVDRSGDPGLAHHLHCVDCSSRASADWHHPNSGAGESGIAESEAAALPVDRPAGRPGQSIFQEKKNDLLSGLKGESGGSSALGLKTPAPPGSDLALKTGSRPPDPPAEPDTTGRKIREAQQRIIELKGDVAGIQGLLRQYSKSLINNAGQFEIWGKTVDAAYANVLDHSREYVQGLFLDQLLEGIKILQKTSPGELGRFVNRSDEGMRAWLSRESGRRKIDPEQFEQLVKLGMAEGDLASLVHSDEGLRKNLDGLILLSDLLDAGGLKTFKNHPFQHARMIGETYSDLVSICYSWFAIHRLEQDTDKLTREMDSLAMRMRHAVKEIDCLEGCVAHYIDQCMEKCTGRTRLHSPPPLPR